MIDEKKLIEELEALKAKTIIFKSDLIFNDAINTVINKVNEQPKVNEWMPVEERLPKKNDFVLVTCDNGEVDYAFYTERGWIMHYIDDEAYPVIAWMPLPESYKGKD